MVLLKTEAVNYGWKAALTRIRAGLNWYCGRPVLLSVDRTTEIFSWRSSE
jgi:hypothetical protein